MNLSACRFVGFLVSFLVVAGIVIGRLASGTDIELNVIRSGILADSAAGGCVCYNDSRLKYWCANVVGLLMLV